jgi:cardiolipin synthase
MNLATQCNAIPLGVLFLLAVASCSTQYSTADDPGQGYPTLQGKFVESGMRQPISAIEAFVGDTEFYVSYETADGLVYAGGNWSNRIDIAALEQADDGTYSGPYLLDLEYQQDERWTDIPASSITPILLSSEQWARFREQLFDSVLPKTEKSGVVMHFNNDDYFFYYNEQMEFEAPLFVDKPADYAVREDISFQDFLRHGLPQLESFLNEEGVSERRIVFSTGDVGTYSLPFLYVNLDRPIAVFVRHARIARSGAAKDTDMHIAQSVGHVAQSHLGGLFLRPVSSVFRLFFVATEVAAETVRPTWLATLESQAVPVVSNRSPMDLMGWEDRLDEIAPGSASSGVISYLIDGEEFFTRFIEALTAAQESVLVRTYIFDNDDFAERIGGLLRRRSAEGVDIKVLLDGLGTIVATGTDPDSLPDDYVPPESVRLFLERDSDIDVRQVRNPWLVAGDHVKTTIVDNEIAFTGGMNIGREYRYSWHDMMMELRGPVVDVLAREFDDAWAHAGPMGDFGYFFHKLNKRNIRTDDEGNPLRVLLTRPGDAQIFRAQREAIRNAQRYIYVENAYFTDDAMLYELAVARRRGVDVRVILPLVSNHGPMNKSNALAANAMLEHGIRVFLYPGMSHIKAAVFDGWACLGSANWDNLSFHTNKELNIATSHPDAVDELLQRLFTTDFGQSVELTEPFPERWSDHLTEILVDYLL